MYNDVMSINQDKSDGGEPFVGNKSICFSSSRGKILFKKRDAFLLFFMFITSMISAISLVCDGDQPRQYQLLFFLPLIFSMLTFLFWKYSVQRAYYNIGIAIIIAELYVRNVITPFIMGIGEYKSIFSISSSSDVIISIALMGYEVFACYLVFFFSYRSRKHYNDGSKITIGVGHKKILTVNVVLITLSLFCLSFYISSSNFRNVYRTIFDVLLSGSKDNSYKYREIFSGDFITRGGITLASFIFSIIRIIVPAHLIVRISERKKSNTRFFFSLLLILTQFLFVPTVAATPIIISLILCLFLIRIYPEKKQVLIIISVAIAVAVVAIFALSYTTLQKWYGLSNIKQYLSYWLNSYMTGIDNVAMTRQITDEKRLQTLLYTLIGSIPFRSVWLPQTAGIVTIDTLFTHLSGCGGQIVSTIGGSAYMLGFLFAPAFSMIFSGISSNYGEKFNHSPNMWKKSAYVYMCVQAALGLGMYNIPITLISIIEVGIPLLLICRLYGRE